MQYTKFSLMLFIVDSSFPLLYPVLSSTDVFLENGGMAEMVRDLKMALAGAFAGAVATGECGGGRPFPR